jgi:hypothetical protein
MTRIERRARIAAQLEDTRARVVYNQDLMIAAAGYAIRTGMSRDRFMKIAKVAWYVVDANAGEENMDRARLRPKLKG